jgi:hypothetical protein
MADWFSMRDWKTDGDGAAGPPRVGSSRAHIGFGGMKSCGRLLSLSAAFPEILKTSAEFVAAQGDDGVRAL